MVMLSIKEHKLMDHGIEHCQYFQGYGIIFTGFGYMSMGAGGSINEAIADAIDQIATAGYDVENLIDAIEQEIAHLPTEQRSRSVCTWLNCDQADIDEDRRTLCESCERYYYMSIRIK